MSPTDELARSYLDLRSHLDPGAASAAGIHGQDNRLGSFDAASVREHLAAFRSLEAAAEALEVESAEEEVDRTALLDEIRVAVFRLQHERAGARNPALWVGHLAGALAEGRRGGGAEGEALLARLRAVPAFLHSAEASLTEPAEALVDLAAELVDPVADLISRRLAEHADDPELYPQLRDAALSAESALARFRLALDTEIRDRSVTHSPGVGEAQFERLLHHQHAVRAGAAELWRTVLRLEEETLAAMRRLAADAGGDWRGLLEERVETADLESDLGAEGLRELRRIEAFLSGADLLPVEVDGLLVEPVPSWLAPSTWPAAYEPPATTGGAGRLLLADRRWTRAFLSPTLAELGVPGLHLQAVLASRLGSEVRRMSNPLLRGGWGLYVLDLLEDAGYWSEPGERLALRAERLFRLALARVDLGVHTRQMTPEEGIAILLDRLPLDPSEAQAAVRGVLLAPTQATGAVAAWTGLVQLRADREKAERPYFTPRRFHEQVLACGGLPVPLVRWAIES